MVCVPLIEGSMQSAPSPPCWQLDRISHFILSLTCIQIFQLAGERKGENTEDLGRIERGFEIFSNFKNTFELTSDRRKNAADLTQTTLSLSRIYFMSS